MKKFIEEFKEFAARGNVMDLAVAVIIGNAINSIVKSAVSDILMPILSIFVGRIDISSLKFAISSSFTHGKSITIGYGSFLESVLNFLTTTLCIFILLKMLNKLRTFTFLKELKDKREKEEPDTPPTTEELLVEIRDLLKVQSGQPELSDPPENFDQEE